MKKKLIVLSGFILGLAPIMVLAQTTGAGPARCVPGARVEDLQTFLCKGADVLNAILPVLIALGIVYFVWGVITYVINDSEEAKKKGKDRIIYGIIGFVVIVGLWGLVSIVVNTFGLRGVSSPDISSLSEGIINSSDGLCNLNSTNPKLQDLLSYITCIIGKSVIPLIFVLAVAMFVWGVVQYVINDSEEAKKKGKNFMIWGIIALTVMVSVWGLVAIVGTTFNIDTGFVPRLKE